MQSHATLCSQQDSICCPQMLLTTALVRHECTSHVEPRKQHVLKAGAIHGVANGGAA